MSEKDIIDQLREHDKAARDKYGYVIHCVIDGEFPNIHTHRLLINYGIIDLQLRIFDGDISFSRIILVNIIDKIINNHTVIKDNISLYYDENIGYIKFKLMRDEFNMPVYRLIIINMLEELQFNDKDSENNHIMLNY